MCLYSFVIPVYNVKPDFLHQCINSILKNDYDALEIILVDDCSTNGCGALCDKYAEFDRRIKVFHQAGNLGVSAARNLGIVKSLGEWIIFVDSDDWIELNICKVLADSISDDADIIVYSAYRESANSTTFFGTSDEKIVYVSMKIEKGGSATGSVKELSDKLLKQSLKTTFPMFDTIKYCWGKAFNRRFLISKEILFADLDYCEDILFMEQAFHKAGTVIQIPNRLYHYRASASSAVNSYRENVLSEQKKFLSILHEQTKQHGNDMIYYAALLSMQICITRYFFNRGNKASFIKRHICACKFFSAWPYTDVFRYIDCWKMKRNEKWKALFIKKRLYYIYYLGTEIRKIKSVRYK